MHSSIRPSRQIPEAASAACTTSSVSTIIHVEITPTRPHTHIIHLALVTHKGAAADAGHYMAYVKKSVFHPVSYKKDEKASLESPPPSYTSHPTGNETENPFADFDRKEDV